MQGLRKELGEEDGDRVNYFRDIFKVFQGKFFNFFWLLEVIVEKVFGDRRDSFWFFMDFVFLDMIYYY